MARPRLDMFSNAKTDKVLAAIDGRGESELTQPPVHEIGIHLIELPANQPRKYFDPDKLAQLVASVREKGILEPLLVRPKGNGQYELVAGERRYRAAKQLELTQVPVTIKELTDSEVLEVALIENLQREDLNPVEEVEGILDLLSFKLSTSRSTVISIFNRLLNEQKGLVNSNVTVNDASNSNVTVRAKEILEAIGVTNWLSFATNKLPLINLPEDVLDALRQGQLEYTKARAISKIKDDEQRQAILAQAISDGLSLNQIKQLIAETTGIKPSKNQLQDKANQTFKLIKKASLDSEKEQQLNHYLDQIRVLLEG